MSLFLKCYFLYGFHQGYTGNSHYISLSKNAVFKEKLAIGFMSSVTYVSILPISLALDILKFKDLLEKNNYKK